MYLFLPDWPIDRLRRTTAATSRGGAAPVEAAPFATVALSEGRRLLAAVNDRAAAAGLAPGMKLADALSFVPGLATVPAMPEADAAALARLAEWCTRYSPWTAPDGADGVRVEITGCAHLWSGEPGLVADLAARLARQKVGHRIAVAGTLGAAWALARFAAASGRPALPESEEERIALAALPVEALRLDPATVAGLRRVGLRRVGDLYPMPRDALARRFGDAVARRLDQALGIAPEPLSPVGETPARRVRLSFAEPIADPADLARATLRLVTDLAVRLERESIGARRLGLAFHRVDGKVEQIRLGTARPSRDPLHLAELFTARLDTVDPGLGVEDMILALYAAEKLLPEQIGIGHLPPFSDNPLHRSGKGGCLLASETDLGLAPLFDRLGARLGPAALSRIALRQSHVPERAAVYVRPLPRPPPQSVAGARRHLPPRPVRLFDPPEPITAAWLLPDDPPFRFTWRRRSYRVRHADGPERIAEEWWTEGGSASDDAIRDYYRVEDDEGRRFWLFRAGLPGDPPPRWFLHGLFA
jgi:protein ImuB